MPDQLSPVRFRLPRRASVGRTALVSVLLLTAALLVESCPDTPRVSVPAGLVGVAVPLAEPAAGSALPPGVHVDLVAVAPATVTISDGLVIGGDTVLLVALPPAGAAAVMNAPAGTAYRVRIRPG